MDKIQILKYCTGVSRITKRIILYIILIRSKELVQKHGYILKINKTMPFSFYKIHVFIKTINTCTKCVTWFFLYYC